MFVFLDYAKCWKVSFEEFQHSYKLLFFRMVENNSGECIPPVLSISVKFLRETGEEGFNLWKQLNSNKHSLRGGHIMRFLPLKRKSFSTSLIFTLVKRQGKVFYRMKWCELRKYKWNEYVIIAVNHNLSNCEKVFCFWWYVFQNQWQTESKIRQ